MSKDPRPAALEILARIERLRRFRQTDPVSLPAGTDDRDIAERCVEVISEASRRLPAAFKASHPHIDWRGIADIGNVLPHGYDAIYEPILVDVIVHQIDTLEAAVATLLNDLDQE